MSRTYLASGSRHIVYREGDYVVKVPHGNLKISLTRAQSSVDFFRKYLSDFSAGTELIPSGRDSYTIYQEYIPGTPLGEYLTENNNISPQIRSLIQSFSLRALLIYRELGITFDILGKQSGISHEIGWRNCTNIVVCPDEKIKFVDTVDFSKSLLQNKRTNNLLQLLLPGRKKRVTLLMKLHSKSGNI
ncbi:hypothetical protein H7170_03535 [Candidatus Gracilibacteria bacterium]|nr:hypothetical protein [Candidatus Gracilibacteria bacterium]